MATLILTAAGTALGGPLGGAIGAMAGRMVDTTLFGSGSRKGPRVKDLAVTTSSYGAVIPRHHGKVRAAGTVIWATDLKEAKKKSGGKGTPKITTYSYSVSFAVALGSNPIAGIGRIWADGNLLRGADGDLKVGGSMRIYHGTDDQTPDSLVASAVGVDRCPAFRGLAYIVFEDLQLTDFGNRIPALTFEILASDGTISLARIIGDPAILQSRSIFEGMIGFSDEGGGYAALVETLDAAWPLSCDGSAGGLTIRDATPSQVEIIELPVAVAGGGDDFGSIGGIASERSGNASVEQLAMRYYDIDRDYQPGLQRSRAVHGTGVVRNIDLPAVLDASKARALAQNAAYRLEGARETIQYRIAQIDPRMVPGAFARVPGRNELWQITAWEWRNTGVELELRSIPAALATGMMASGSSGEIVPPDDAVAGITRLYAFGLPWDGIGNAFEPRVFAAVSSEAEGWRGAALFADRGDGQLDPIGSAGRDRAVIGTCEAALPTASPHVFDRESEIVVQLLADDMILNGATVSELTNGANRARVGSEIIQFGKVTDLGGGRWRIGMLMRGRGGTESQIDNHVPDEGFVLIDDRLTQLDASVAVPPVAQAISAIGYADTVPASAVLDEPFVAVRPFSPVRATLAMDADGVTITWTRRSRGSFYWQDEIEVPLREQGEEYQVQLFDTDTVISTWRTTIPAFELSASQWAATGMSASHFEIRQIGAAGLSPALLISIPSPA